MPIHEWLSVTRRIDMSRAIAKGRHIERKRYGGLDPDNVLLSGTRIGDLLRKFDLPLLHRGPGDAYLFGGQPGPDLACEIGAGLFLLQGELPSAFRRSGRMENP